METEKRDPKKVNPLSGAEDPQPAPPLETVPDGENAHAANTVIPGTGEVIRDVNGQEVKRVVRT